jgi:rhamnose transport system permease protein
MNLKLQRQWPSLAALLGLYAFLAFAAPRFFDIENLRDLALTNIPVLLVASGMTLVIVVAEIDISVGSVFAVTSVACGVLAKRGLAIPLLPIAAVAIGSLLGAINGGLVSYVRAPSIVVTLATMVSLREALRWATGGAWVQDLPAGFQWFGWGQSAGEALIMSAALILFAGLWWSSENLSAVREVYATGSDAEAARLAGMATERVVFWVFVLLGALTGIAALLNSVRFADIPANSGINLELQAIAAVVVGGTPITGGQGSLLGTLIGVLLLGSISPALTYLGISPYWVRAIQGAIVLVTVFFDAVVSRRQKHMVTA